MFVKPGSHFLLTQRAIVVRIERLVLLVIAPRVVSINRSNNDPRITENSPWGLDLKSEFANLYLLLAAVHYFHAITDVEHFHVQRPPGVPDRHANENRKL